METSPVANPWMKKNPFMSMWLSGANAVGSRARGHAAVEANIARGKRLRRAGVWAQRVARDDPSRMNAAPSRHQHRSATRIADAED
jgi:hypothetical protein